MFLRNHKRFKDGKDHSYWSLLETERTDKGPRHRLLCYLGELNNSQKKSWRKIIRVFNNDGQEEQLALFPGDSAPEDGEDIVKINLKSVRLERAREFGAIYTGVELWKRLGLDKFWEEKIDPEPEQHSGRMPDVAWSKVAAILAINRLCAPGSELAIEEKWFKSTALDDLLNVAEEKIHTDRLYECLDHTLEHKEEMEKHLKKRYGELFEIKYDILLYDITSTYFEGRADANPQAQRGYSRDHRPDCKQVCIALVVSEEGFPLAYEVFDGSRVDVTTLEEIIEAVEHKYGKARRVWVFDRGIVSEENLAMLRRKKAQYLVGTRRNELKKYEAELLDKSWQKVREDVEVKMIPAGKGEETYVLCRAGKRGDKEEAMRETASKKLEKRLNKLAERIKVGKLKDRIKIERRIGAVLGKYSSISDLYEVRVDRNSLTWTIDEKKIKWRKAREGAYLLRTNITEKDPSQLWEKYMQLTEAEAAFRALKSELVIRPIWHQKKERVQAHILVAFMGYALWVTLKHTLRNAGSNYSPARALDTLKRIHSGDIIMQTVDMERYQIRLRRVFHPDEEQKALLNALKMDIPKRLSFDLKSKCSADLRAF
jgi:transposase